LGRREGQGSTVFKGLDQTTARCCAMFGEGRPIKEIAAILNLSEKTVEFHKHHIMDGFNLKSNADLVLFALKRGLIGIPA
jgi:DNA-binding CsgD family transcriptional regulator